MIDSNEISPKSLVNQFDVHKFSSDVIIIFLGQGVLLAIGFILGLIIPKYTTIETYGYWQLFLLYGGLVGILHLGFTEGVLLRWAGKTMDDLSAEIPVAIRFLLLEQFILTIPLAIIFYFTLHSNYMFIGFSLLVYAILFNLVAFFIYIALSVKKFRLLMGAYILQSALFLSLTLLFFWLGYSSYKLLICIFILAAFSTALFFVIKFHRVIQGNKPSLKQIWTYGREHIRLAFLLYIALIAFSISWNLDRLMVSSFFPVEQFAFYAFALSIALVILGFVGAVSNVVYPYVAGAVGELRARVYKLIKPVIISSWAVVLAIYFPFERLIAFYLPQYVPSLPLVKILFLVIGFSSLIQIVHINYYRSYFKQTFFFISAVIAMALLFGSNYAVIKLIGTLESVAIATLASFCIWYIINDLYFQPIIGQNKSKIWGDLIPIILYGIAFWVSSLIILPWYLDMLIYLAVFGVITALLYRREIKEISTILKNSLKPVT